MDSVEGALGWRRAQIVIYLQATSMGFANTFSRKYVA